MTPRILLGLLGLLALPLAAHAGPKEDAKKHIAAATEAHQQGKYDLAINELYAAYNLDPQPDLLYAIGQVEVKRGHCMDAIRAYEKFLESKPAPEPAAAAQEAIESCKAQEPPPAPPPVEAKPASAPPPPPPPPEGKPFYTDIIGSALVGGGILAGAAGAVFYVAALHKLDDADKAATYDAHGSLVHDAETQRNIALVCGGVALVAIGVGVWHYTQYADDQSHVAVAPISHGGMVAWSGRF